MTLTVMTNNHHRPAVDAWELTPSERAQFDYLDWAAIEGGSDSASFFRYRGELCDLGEFSVMTTRPDELKARDRYRSGSLFSALVVRYGEDDDGLSVVVGLVLS